MDEKLGASLLVCVLFSVQDVEVFLASQLRYLSLFM